MMACGEPTRSKSQYRWLRSPVGSIRISATITDRELIPGLERGQLFCAFTTKQSLIGASRKGQRLQVVACEKPEVLWPATV
jgi:hypothetical protein